MRSKKFVDWLLEGLLLLIFSSLVIGLHYAGLNYGDPVVTMWAVAAVWITFGLARYIRYRWGGRH